MSGLLQLAGAVLVLAAYVTVQLGVARPSSGITLILNLVGSGVLAVLALIAHQWGFLLLEAAWSAVSAAIIARHLFGRTPA